MLIKLKEKYWDENNGIFKYYTKDVLYTNTWKKKLNINTLFIKEKLKYHSKIENRIYFLCA